jgi:hypothetical protein
MAILGQAALQLADIRAQLRDLLLLLGDLGFELGNALVGGHASLLYPLRKSA